jgi:CheY-like chemotaxis protein
MSGIEATRAIRDLEAKNLGTMKRSLIIALTGLAGTDNIDEAYDAGVDLFLTKPVSFKTVDRELEKWKEHMKTAIVVKDTPSSVNMIGHGMPRRLQHI